MYGRRSLSKLLQSDRPTYQSNVCQNQKTSEVIDKQKINEIKFDEAVKNCTTRSTRRNSISVPDAVPSAPCAIKKRRQTIGFKATTRSADAEIESELKLKFNISEIAVPLDRMRQEIFHYKPVSSIAFTIQSGSNGIIIKCLKGCDYHKSFDNIATMHTYAAKHFREKHQEDAKWNGYCSTCRKYIHKGTDMAKFTLIGEIHHIARSHTTVNPNGKKKITLRQSSGFYSLNFKLQGSIIVNPS